MSEIYAIQSVCEFTGGVAEIDILDEKKLSRLDIKWTESESYEGGIRKRACLVRSYRGVGPVRAKFAWLKPGQYQIEIDELDFLSAVSCKRVPPTKF